MNNIFKHKELKKYFIFKTQEDGTLLFSRIDKQNEELKVVEHSHLWQVNVGGVWMAFDKLTLKSTDGVFTLFSITNWSMVKPNTLVEVEEDVDGQVVKSKYYTTGKYLGTMPSD